VIYYLITLKKWIARHTGIKMTSIDTVVAKKYWKDETKYLDKIQFVAITPDKKNITLLGDEEGNLETILTPKSARHIAKQLNEMADCIEVK